MHAAGTEVRKYQKTHVIAAMAGYDDVLRQRRQRGDPGDAQCADADPGAGIEFEILGDAAVEKQSELRAIRIGEVSVEPQADTIGSARPTVLIDSSSIASQRFCGNAAPA